jgi:hypothetical protein
MKSKFVIKIYLHESFNCLHCLHNYRKTEVKSTQTLQGYCHVSWQR